MSLVLTLLLTTTLQTEPRLESRRPFFDAAVATARPAVSASSATRSGKASPERASRRARRSATPSSRRTARHGGAAARPEEDSAGDRRRPSRRPSPRSLLLAKTPAWSTRCSSRRKSCGQAQLLELPDSRAPRSSRPSSCTSSCTPRTCRATNFYASCARLADSDRILALNAMLEGHAQHVAPGVRRARQRGRLLRDVTQGHHRRGAGHRGGRRGRASPAAHADSTFDGMYVGGERLSPPWRPRPRATASAAFREPPRDMAEIQRPEWYLDPALRPVTHLRS